MKTILFSVLLSFVCYFSTAHELSGTIYNSLNNPIQGIGVYNKNSGKYTYSDKEGYFKLEEITIGDSIHFYGLGYEAKHMIVKSKQLNNSLDIFLEDAALTLDQIVLYSEADPLSKLVHIDLAVDPVRSSQELLQKVPGLIIGQHAGGGKAEQLFIRGFDVDHGTDVAISVDGLPVNMVSHAHGQGYADLHFVIPETVRNLDFGKGPYYADQGNFNTAGYVSLNLKERMEENILSFELGQFNTNRLFGAVQVLDENVNQAYIATELMQSDGVFEAPQNFNRFNILGRYKNSNGDGRDIILSISHFQSKWDASGQIPQRAVDAGLISRFGAIDATEGGQTSRTNLWLKHNKIFNDHNALSTSAYVSTYKFNLFSNFTFFLEDPENGDQIRQSENRITIGAQTVYRLNLHQKNEDEHNVLEVGAGFRFDDVNDVALSRTANRNELLERLAFGDVDELNAFSFAKMALHANKLSIYPGLRADLFNFRYLDFLAESDTQQAEFKTFLSPSLHIKFNQSNTAQHYAKIGYGYHANDTRVVVRNAGQEIIPGALGIDLGSILRPTNNLVVNAALWGLWMEQEFVYVGDAGIVEPSGRTRRLGLDLGLRYQFQDLFYVNGDINYAYAIDRDAVQGSNYIPLAPPLTVTGGITVPKAGAFSGGINFRYLSDRPANEDNSIIAQGYFVTDLNLNYEFGNWKLGLEIENLFDTDWNETQFATLSRLQGEDLPVEEIHFTPGTPFFVKSKLSFSF